MRRPQILTRDSLVRRFFFVFLLVIAVPVVVLWVAVTLGYRKFSLELASGRIGQTLSQLAQGIDEELRRTALLTAILSTNGAPGDSTQFIANYVYLKAFTYSQYGYGMALSVVFVAIAVTLSALTQRATRINGS